MDIDPIEPDQPGSQPEHPDLSNPGPWNPAPSNPAPSTSGLISGAAGEAATGKADIGRRPPLPPARTSTHIVYLDPKLDRPASPYSPEGEIRMFGEFAAGLSRRGAVSRWMGIALMLVVLTPIVLSLLAVVTHW